MNKKHSTQYSVNARDLHEKYDEHYLKWKGWCKKLNFGILKPTEAAYFEKEISRTGIRISANSKVLEVGFGNGSFLKFARDKNWDVYGTELNESLVEMAKNNGYKVIHAANLSDFNDDSFDLVVAFDVLEHISQEVLPNMICEIKRILKKDGFFIARFPNGDSPFGLRNQNGDVTHITTIGSKKAYYFANICEMTVIFIGGEAQPLFGASLPGFFRLIFAIPIKKLINIIVNLVFYPRANVFFCSCNLTMIFKKSQ